MRWEIFCRVIDNHGDLGVCWRLAADLAGRGETVRLWVDDASALRWMAPAGHPGVTVAPWTPERVGAEIGAVGDVVVEAFGCDPPPGFVDAMRARAPAPVWINLEYLSAEGYVARSHGLLSPAARAQGLGKWFFFPGFDAGTGGLLREPGLLQRRARFDKHAWRAAHGIAVQPGERVVSLFSYAPPPLEPWLAALSRQPTVLLLPPGPARQALHAVALPPGLRGIDIPWLPQAGYDQLLWSCDLNVVRGEDSFVRAQWAGVPFIWHIYPQDDGVHAGKLDAFLDRFLAGAGGALAAGVRQAVRQWNGLAAAAPVNLPDCAAGSAWAGHCRRWRDELGRHDDLTTALVRLCREKARLGC